MAARYFTSSEAFRTWLDRNHASKRELVLGFYKRGAAKQGITYPEALDEALAYGWIDGVRTRVDDGRYTIRFTPRTKGSIWSAVNIRNANALIKSGAMAPAGLAAFRGRDRSKAGKYSYENRPERLGGAHARTFKANPAAWAFFTAQPPGYQRVTTWYVVSAVKEETQQKRLVRLIEASAEGRRMDELFPGKPRYG
jgi:uncharacterized protein YdeI (YjbR/CyaY-like superfamily)